MKKLVVTMVAVACLPMVGCKKAGSGPSSLDEEGGARQQHSDPLVELELLEQEMNRLGLRTAADEDTIAPGSAGEGAGADGEVEPGAEAEALERPAPTEAAAADRPPPPKRAELQQCADLCDLSQAICELETRICSLSSSHGDDPTYADACRRAGEDCEVADDACSRCAG